MTMLTPYEEGTIGGTAARYDAYEERQARHKTRRIASLVVILVAITLVILAFT